MIKIILLAVLILIGPADSVQNRRDQFRGNGQVRVSRALVKRQGGISAGGGVSGGAGGHIETSNQLGAHLNLHINLKTGLVGRLMVLIKGAYNAYMRLVKSLMGAAGGSFDTFIGVFVESIEAAFGAISNITINTFGELRGVLAKFAGLLSIAIKNGNGLVTELWNDGQYVLASNVKFLTGLLQGLFSLTHAFHIKVEGGLDNEGSGSGVGGAHFHMSGHIGHNGGAGASGSGTAGASGSGAAGAGGAGHVHIGGGGSGHGVGTVHVGGGGSGHGGIHFGGTAGGAAGGAGSIKGHGTVGGAGSIKGHGTAGGSGTFHIGGAGGGAVAGSHHAHFSWGFGNRRTTTTQKPVEEEAGEGEEEAGEGEEETGEGEEETGEGEEEAGEGDGDEEGGAEGDGEAEGTADGETEAGGEADGGDDAGTEGEGDTAGDDVGPESNTDGEEAEGGEGTDDGEETTTESGGSDDETTAA